MLVAPTAPSAPSALSALLKSRKAPRLLHKPFVLQILNYCATHPDATVYYTTSGMILQSIHSNASYLLEAKNRPNTGGTFFLHNKLEKP
jgi:hypothetical protein